jgi:hypothetical protein
MMRMQANSCGQVLWYAELSPVACGVPVVVVYDQCDGMCACGIRSPRLSEPLHAV